MNSPVKKHEPQVISLVNLNEEVASTDKATSTAAAGVTRDDLREQLKRRRVPRRPINIPVGILHQGHYQVATCHEIGEGGMLIDSDVKLAQDDNVVITLRIADVISGVIQGKVVYAMASEKQEHARYGIMFEVVDFEVKRKLRNFVASATKYVLGS